MPESTLSSSIFQTPVENMPSLFLRRAQGRIFYQPAVLCAVHETPCINLYYDTLRFEQVFQQVLGLKTC